MLAYTKPQLKVAPPLSDAGIRRSSKTMGGFLSLGNLVIFLIPATMFLEIAAIGRLFVSDLLCIALFPILLSTKSGLLKNPYARIFILLGTVYLGGQIVTDLVVGSNYHNFIRGWAKIGVTIIAFCTIFMLIDGRRSKIIIFCFGLAAGGLFSFYFNPGIYAESHPWKFGIGGPVTLMIVLFATFYGEKFNLKYILLVAIGSLNLYLGFRSLAGLCFMTAAFLFLYARLQLRFGTKRIPISKLVFLGVGILAAALIVLEFYSFSVSKGWLDENARRLYEWQSQGAFGILVGARSEILVSIRAIWDAPFLGHGSWAHNWEYVELLHYLKGLYGYAQLGVGDSGLIPAHSHIFGGWVESGLAGAIFWIWILSLPVRALIRLLPMKDPHLPLIVFIALSLIWDLFFSPFGAARRFIIPFYVVVMMDILTRYNFKKKSSR